MSVAPSCPVLLVHEDDAYRRALIKALDERHFSVTYTDDEQEAVRTLGEKTFLVIIVGAEQARVIQEGDDIGAAVIVLGRPSAELTRAADETLLKPVDAAYVAERARTYCR
jgi:ActR/RegA family two-component response regulator